MLELSDEEFYEALSSEDDLGMVIRAHIHIEHWLDRFLLSAMPYYSKYEKDIKANYETKVFLCLSVGLTPELKAPLKSIGKIRNKFAHEPSYKLDKSDADNFYSVLSGVHKQHLKSAYKEVSIDYRSESQTFAELDNAKRLTYLFTFLRKKLKKALVQLNEEK